MIAYDGTNQENLVNNVETQMTNTMYRGVGWFAKMAGFPASERFDYIISHGVFVLVVLIVLVLVGLSPVRLGAARRCSAVARIGLGGAAAGGQFGLARQLGFYDDLLKLLDRHDVHRPAHLTPMEFSRSLTFLPAEAYETSAGSPASSIGPLRRRRARPRPAESPQDRDRPAGEWAGAPDANGAAIRNPRDRVKVTAFSRGLNNVAPPRTHHPMCAIILSIGDELVLGQTVDTNSAWLSQQLAAVGCPSRPISPSRTTSGRSSRRWRNPSAAATY